MATDGILSHNRIDQETYHRDTEYAYAYANVPTPTFPVRRQERGSHLQLVKLDTVERARESCGHAPQETPRTYRTQN